MQLLTKPCKARVNTIPLQHRGAERTADQHIANATAQRQWDFQLALLSQLLHTNLTGLQQVLYYWGSYKASAKMFITLKIDIIVLKKPG